MTEMRQYRGIPVNGIKEIRPDNSIGPIPFVHGGHCEVENKHYIILDDAELFASNFDGEMIYGFIEVIPETVGEYTGLKDKNGVEIYEGDIICYSSVELEDDKGVVEYEVRRYAGFSLKSIQTRQFSFLSTGNNKVIGNRHENPELLETK